MKSARFLVNTLVYTILVVSLVAFITPFLLIIINSFKTNAEIIESPLAWPTTFNFSNFAASMKEMNYFQSFLNSLGITLGSVVLIGVFAAMTAHYFVRNKTKTNGALFFAMVASMIIPFQAIMIPLVSLYGAKLGWIQTMPKSTLIFMYLGFGSPLAVFIYHGFVKSIPLELEEAAFMDGCDRRGTFFRIILPILMPTTVTIGILNILWIWNDFLLPLLVLQNAGRGSYTLPLAIQVFKGTYTTDNEKFLPAVLLVILPILIVYLFAQRFIIQGVTQGSVK
ncbi:carbohydrate ABC transporter permease [Paenibacillus azoreducens]|uniref:Sugar ABC transporter permease n=1 Tax=Paenibacillus azoreducens TaxID=116718 RepID=A0A919Y7Z7_9BACL|nr:carbohydrate ABC transporter permease [Paenibacillus azoreducens]GIO46641.1 sugar ABC transporter permease [Paenibacillus azoreducens]